MKANKSMLTEDSSSDRKSKPRTSKKEHEKFEKYQGLKEGLENLWCAKATVVLVVLGTL